MLSFVVQQIKQVFCKTLAACLCMKRSPSQSQEPPRIYRKTSFAVGDRDSNNSNYNSMTTHVAPPTDNEAFDTVLQEIRDLQKRRLHNEEQQRYDDDKENEIINDWMLAAAVLDRICAIAFAIIFIGGTSIFIAVIVTHA